MTPVDAQDEPDGSDDTEPDHATVAGTETGTDTEPEWARRRRLDAVFGDGAHGQALGDRWYRDQVPPHHG